MRAALIVLKALTLLTIGRPVSYRNDWTHTWQTRTPGWRQKQRRKLARRCGHR